MRKMPHMMSARAPLQRFFVFSSLMVAMGTMVVGCGTLIGNPGEADTGADVGSDVGISDSGSDTAVTDTSADVSPDVAEDVQADTATDAGIDTSEDTVPQDTSDADLDVLLDSDADPDVDADTDVGLDTDLDTDLDSSDADVSETCDPIASMGCDAGDCVVENGEAVCGQSGTAAVREACEVDTDAMELSCVPGASCLEDDFGAQCRVTCTGDEHCTDGVPCHRTEGESYGTCGCLPFFGDDGCNVGCWCE